jgi:hypothetical protein
LKLSSRELIDEFRGENSEEPESAGKPDALLSGKIQRDEKTGGRHLIEVQSMLVHSASGEVIWSGGRTGSAAIRSTEWELDKTILVVCLAFAAGILVIYARRENPAQAVSAEE